MSNFTSPASSTATPRAKAMETDHEADEIASIALNEDTITQDQTATDESGANTDTILAAIDNMKTEFSTRFDGLFTAIENVRQDVSDCTERVTQAEARISTTEDSVTTLQTKVQSLEGKNKDLEEKILDLEARSRRSNLRLVNLPEGAEGEDACTFLESWIPEVLELRAKPTVERAHRIGPRSDTNAAPRTLIMKFLSYKDKEAVVRAAKSKGQILYKNHHVRLYQDVAAGLHKKQKEFDEARRQLRSLGLRYGIIPPARLIVTHKGRSHIFNNPSEAEDFIRRIKSEEH